MADAVRESPRRQVCREAGPYCRATRRTNNMTTLLYSRGRRDTPEAEIEPYLTDQPPPMHKTLNFAALGALLAVSRLVDAAPASEVSRLAACQLEHPQRL